MKRLILKGVLLMLFSGITAVFALTSNGKPLTIIWLTLTGFLYAEAIRTAYQLHKRCNDE